MESSPPPFITSPSRWWSKETIAVVTGANKGIGYAIVKRLAEVGVTVILTARNTERGEIAVERLRRSGLKNVCFWSLDVSCQKSIHGFVSWFQLNFRTLDILVNNAAVSFNNMKENSVNHSKIVIGTNYYGAKLLTESLLPYFRRSGSFGRILNVSSRLGALDKVRNEEIRSVLKDDKLTKDQISNIVDIFVKSVEEGTWEKQGWPEVWTEYAVSKLALNSYTKVLAKQNEGCGLCVNCFCPGFTQTGMTGGVGKRTAEDAAKLAVDIVLAPVESVSTGKFYAGEDPHYALKSRL